MNTMHIGSHHERRVSLLREAIGREYLIFFVHDPEITAGYIREANGRRLVDPVCLTQSCRVGDSGTPGYPALRPPRRFWQFWQS